MSSLRFMGFGDHEKELAQRMGRVLTWKVGGWQHHLLTLVSLGEGSRLWSAMKSSDRVLLNPFPWCVELVG